MKWKEQLAAYLTLSRKERTGVIVLGLIILSLFGLPSLLPTSGPPLPGPADTAWVLAMKKLEDKKGADRTGDWPDRDENKPSSGKAHYASPEKTVPGDLFPFDPNGLDEKGWGRLGLREKTIKTILNYLSKGGRFRRPEDLQRIYGLFPDEYERLRPYIRIPEAEKINSTADRNEKREIERTSGNYPMKKKGLVEINTADTSDLIALPGIGSKLAQRIIHFREKLGGFHTVGQVAETFGLADSVFRKIEPLLKLEVRTLRKININTATAEEMKGHPYLRWNVINAILAYRKEHGLFRKMEELKQVMAVTDEVYERISPYLITE